MANNRTFAIGMGSNLGDRRQYMESALVMLDRIDGLQVRATAPLYESEGWGIVDQPRFLNSVVVAESATLTPHQVLHSLQKIEDVQGRQRSLKWGPRTLDLDLLAVDDLAIADAELTLPHPWIAKRPFVYLPLRNVATHHSSWTNLTGATEEGLAIENQTRVYTEGPQVPWGMTRNTPTNAVVVQSASEEETLNLGAMLSRWLLPGDLIGVDAPMGAGKSVISRGIARGLGITGKVPSPTYTLCRRYDEGRISFEHWDLYRLGSPDELESTGFHSDEAHSAVRVVEWASMFPSEFKRANLHIRLTISGEDSRKITVESGDSQPLPFALQSALESWKENQCP